MEVNNGFLIIDKGKNCTSHDCVYRVRKILNIKKVGHTGTLDPQVTGVLPLALGSATRFIQYLPQEKTYCGIIQLGIKTTTDDISGEIIAEKIWPKLNFNELNIVLDFFRGTFNQTPPNVSSVHINGERAYKRSWKKENFILPAKKVSVSQLKLIKWDQKKGQLTIEITCSAGTYIRSIARDLGTRLKSEGCLLNLRRIKASGFKEDISIDLDKLIKEKHNINKNIIPISSALSHLPKLHLNNDQDILYWQTGRQIQLNEENLDDHRESFCNKYFLVFDIKYQLLGIGITNSKNSFCLQPKLVLNAK